MSDVEMTDLSNMRAKLQFDYQHAPPAMIDDAIICAAREICKRPLISAWFDLTGDLQGCESTYDFSDHLPEGLEMSGILAVEYCGCCIPDVDPKCNPCANGWSLCDDTSITLHPEVGNSVTGQTLRVCVSMTVAADACSIPSLLMRRYQKEIRDLARSELSRAPNQEWTDPRYSDYIGRSARGSMKEQQGRVARNATHKGIRKAKVRRWLM